MESKWAKAKKALVLNLCVNAPMTLDDSSMPYHLSDRSSDSVEISPRSAQLTKTGSRTFKKTCAICLGSIKPGHGHALFTAECSHTFHFNCITSNIKHGNYICPVCRAKWKEIPFQVPSLPDQAHGRTRVNPLNYPNGDPIMTILRHNSRANYSNRRSIIDMPSKGWSRAFSMMTSL